MSDKASEITKVLQDKYPEVGIRSVEIDEDKGTSTLFLNPTPKALAFLDGSNGITGVIPRMYRDRASMITRDAVSRTSLDLSAKSSFDEPPLDSMKRARKYYYTEPLVGSTINILAELSSKGMENDIDDPNIQNFYDVWCFDVNFEETVEWMFLEFFRSGNVTTYKVLQKYEPRVSYLSPAPGQKMKKTKTVSKELAAKKNIWSKGHLPVSYTVLNPELVVIDGNLLFDKVSVKLTLPPEMSEMFKKPSSELTEDEKLLIKSLPSDIKAAAQKGGEVALDPRLVGRVNYRKQPYERYAKPRSARVFDSIEYKRSLREADLSTLDGISNYILKVTIGNDEFPVQDQAELEAVSQLFNTPSKSFDVVWNHTLEVEKIVSPEIASILGQEKYKQVNDDITGGLAMTRALIDGSGDVNAAEVSLIVKGLQEEISYARRQVSRWIYREYQQIAEAMGFDRFPKIRWDEGVLKDTILYMSTLAQLVDRRMLSYRTSLESLGFDYPNELKNMEEELPLVEDGTFGILGSPFQQSKIQPVQNSPAGTPSSGRPTGQPAKTKTKETDPVKKTKSPPKTESKVLKDAVKEMDEGTFLQFVSELGKMRGGSDGS